MTRATKPLYSGADLERAAASSSPNACLNRARGLLNGAGQLLRRFGPATNLDYRSPLFRETARVRTRGHDEPLTLTYVGRGASRNWLMEGLFEYIDGQRSNLDESHRLAEADFDDSVLTFVDEPSLAGDSRLIRTPSWVKQKIGIAREWHEQLASLPRARRREVARTLRRQGYAASVRDDADAAARFYDELYRPYVTTRHNAAAVIVERDEFLRECRTGGIVELRQAEQLIGASLLRPIANALAVVWTGLRLDQDGHLPRGAADALDYFSLLLAQLHGFRWLELGPSRPSLNDGTFRYKSRWNACVHAGRIASAPFGWRINRAHPALPNALAQNALLHATPAGFGCRLVLPADDARQQHFDHLHERWRLAGIDEVQIIRYGDNLAFEPKPDKHVVTATSIDELVQLFDPAIR